MSDGWKCPGCGRCYAPSVTSCAHCDPSNYKTFAGVPIVSNPTLPPGTMIAVAQNRCTVCGRTLENWMTYCPCTQRSAFV